MGYNESGKAFLTDALKELENYDVASAERDVTIDKVINEADASHAVPGSDALTIVSKSMVIDGNIASTTAVAVNGRVNGNITTTKELGVSGLVIGDSKAEVASFNNAKVQGNVASVDQITVSDGSIILGNLSSNHVSIDGKVKGLIKAASVADFGENALVVGEVITGAIHMKENARINAKITLSNKSVTEETEEEFNLGV